MSHECPECGMVCGCDMEDHDQPQPDDCTHIQRVQVETWRYTK
jgi:hypothetical protein